MKKSMLIGMGIAVAIVIILAVSWFVVNERTNTPQLPSPPVNATIPAGHSYSLNLTESVGMQANP